MALTLLFLISRKNQVADRRMQTARETESNGTDSHRRFSRPGFDKPASWRRPEHFSSAFDLPPKDERVASHDPPARPLLQASTLDNPGVLASASRPESSVKSPWERWLT